MAQLPLTMPSAQWLYDNLAALASTLQSRCVAFQAQIASGNPVLVSSLARLLTDTLALSNAAQNIQSNAAVSAAVVAYMASVPGADTSTVSTDFPASLALVEALVAAIVKDFPVDSNGYMLERTLSSAGVVTEATLTAAQLADVSAAMIAWLATV